MSVALEAAFYPSVGRARYAQVVLALVALFSAMDSQVVGLLIEPIKHELKLADVQVGLAYGTAYFAAYGVLAAPAGLLADRLPRVRLLMAAVTLNCASMVLTGLSHGLGMLVLSKVVSGVSAAMTYPAAISLLSDFFAPDRRAFGSLSYGVGQQLGRVAALLVGGLGYSALVTWVAHDPRALGGLAPWRVVSLIFAVVGILIPPLLLATREPARMEIRSADKGAFRELWEFRATLVPLFLGIMCLSGASSGLYTFLAPALMRLYKLQPGDFALPASVITIVCGLAAVAAAGKLINAARARGGNRAMLLPAAITTLLIVPCTAMGLMPNVAGFAVLYVFFLFLNDVAIFIPVTAINFQLPNELRGLSMGAYVVLIAIAGMIGSPLVGYVGSLLGGDQMIGAAMAVVAAPLAAVAAVCFWAASRARAPGPPSVAITRGHAA
ncbi:MAG TPA: MFS transporter [Caulobacteraceae bacterium]|nr:MFS transporter [Caulobacteraceae bacterium]